MNLWLVETYEYVKEYHRFNRICKSEAPIEDVYGWILSGRFAKLIESGYKVIIRPVDPGKLW